MGICVGCRLGDSLTVSDGERDAFLEGIPDGTSDTRSIGFDEGTPDVVGMLLGPLLLLLLGI